MREEGLPGESKADLCEGKGWRLEEPVGTPVVFSGDGEPMVEDLAGQVKEALTPVAPPASVKDRLRSELLLIVEQRTRRELVVEPIPRRRKWAIGAAVGSVLALAGGALYWLRNRTLGGERSAESR